jgi:hypothetical protein
MVVAPRAFSACFGACATCLRACLTPYSQSTKRWRKSTYLWAIERKHLRTAQRIYTTPEEAELAARQIAYLPKAAVVPLGADAPAGGFEDVAAQFLTTSYLN